VLGGMHYCSGNIPISIFVGYASLFLFCLGFLIVNINALAMQSLAHYAGTGAAFVGALSTLVSIPIAVLTGELTRSTAMPLAWCFFISASVALVIHLMCLRKAQLETKDSN
jgi:DHA1 family bicyclomycin/chloramphenicol resistance-like MFS transporter